MRSSFTLYLAIYGVQNRSFICSNWKLNMPSKCSQDMGVLSLFPHLIDGMEALHLVLCHHQCVCAKSLQSCLTVQPYGLYSPPGSSVHGILQSRILERVAMPSSRGSSQPRDWTCILTSPALAGGFFTASHLGSPATDSTRAPVAVHLAYEAFPDWVRRLETTATSSTACFQLLELGEGSERGAQLSPVNNTALNIMYKFLCRHRFSFPLGVCLSVNARLYVSSTFSCFKAFRLLSKAAEHFTFPSTGYEGSTFSTFLSKLVIVCLFF